MDDKFAVSLLDAVIVLINTCNNAELKHIPRELCECFSAFLKERWGKVRDQLFLGKISRSSHERKSVLSNFTINNLAESLFRLSLNRNKCTAYPHKVVTRSIFGSSGPSLKSFLLEYWEISPLLVERTLNASSENFFRSITDSLYLKGSLYSSSSSILQNLISCPPIDSDELDILNFLKETRNTLGCTLIYEQDLRIVKTDNQTKSEVHFFPENLNSPRCMKLPSFLYVDDISKCEEALKKGYTIALRGAEFRFESIASFADGLASLFGQPSVGANLYLTPPNSQGLALHYDDHCVFVCQLLGKKQWRISSRPCVQLPRLYAPLDTIDSEGLESSMNECINCMLKEGDVLYIPRGYPHEASTESTEPDGSAEFSLHLTLAIEVEPPFEWEGFVHVAVCFWSQTSNQYHQASTDSLSKALHVMSINLLHVIIGLIADSDHKFRKACLVAASFLPPDTTDWLHLNQETTFSILIDRIRSASESTFSSALKIVEAAIQNDEDPFQRMRWLESFDLEGETSEVHGWILPFTGIKNLLRIYIQHKDIAESVLMQVKAKFCDEILLEQAVHPYKRLLEKYKKTRKQYINGMLSLHSN